MDGFRGSEGRFRGMQMSAWRGLSAGVKEVVLAVMFVVQVDT